MNDDKKVPESLSQLIRQRIYNRFGEKGLITFLVLLASVPFVYPSAKELWFNYSNRIGNTAKNISTLIEEHGNLNISGSPFDSDGKSLKGSISYSITQKIEFKSINSCVATIKTFFTGDIESPYYSVTGDPIPYEQSESLTVKFGSVKNANIDDVNRVTSGADAFICSRCSIVQNIENGYKQVSLSAASEFWNYEYNVLVSLPKETFVDREKAGKSYVGTIYLTNLLAAEKLVKEAIKLNNYCKDK